VIFTLFAEDEDEKEEMRKKCTMASVFDEEKTSRRPAIEGAVEVRGKRNEGPGLKPRLI
jgi:hypothetical protein